MAMFRKQGRGLANPPAVMAAAASPQAARNAGAKKRQQLLLAGGAAVVLVGGSAYIFSGGPAKVHGVDPSKPTEVKVATDDMVNRPRSEQQWMAASENALSDHNQRLKAVEQQAPAVTQMHDQIASLQQDNARTKADATKLFQIYQAENDRQRQRIEALKQGTAQGGSTGPAGFAGAAGGRPGASGVEPFRVAGGAGGYGSGAGYDAQGRPLAPGAGAAGYAAAGGAEVKTINFSGGGSAAGAGGAGGGSGPKGPVGFAGVHPDAPPTVIEDSADYLPPNSYAPARVIVGVDASAGVSSQTDPLPVVLRITGPARSVVNNGKVLTTRLEGCVVNGAARGDLSAEKVYVKLAKMTCDQPGGRVAVTEVKGFISFGGKTGVRGRVVTREGGLIGQAFLAGIAGGFGRGFSANANTALTGSNVTVNGQRQMLSPTEIATGGIGEGVSKAGDMVSKYLIERAEQYQPVIEMPTGIDVEIVFLDGVYVRGQ